MRTFKTYNFRNYNKMRSKFENQHKCSRCDKPASHYDVPTKIENGIQVYEDLCNLHIIKFEEGELK